MFAQTHRLFCFRAHSVSMLVAFYLDCASLENPNVKAAMLGQAHALSTMAGLITDSNAHVSPML